jgi:hypothetical protein
VVLLTVVNLKTLRPFTEHSAQDPPPASPLRVHASLRIINERVIESHTYRAAPEADCRWQSLQTTGYRYVPIDLVFAMKESSSTIKKSYVNNINIMLTECI